MKASFNFTEPVRFLVVHPQYGQVVVQAYCVFDAKMQAANQWEVPVMDIAAQCKVGIDKQVLREMKQC